MPDQNKASLQNAVALLESLIADGDFSIEMRIATRCHHGAGKLH